MVRDGKVIFEDFKGKYKDDFKSGDKIMPQNTNSLNRSNPDPVVAETETLGHFVSSPLMVEEDEDEDDEDDEEQQQQEEEEEEEQEVHYALTIGHVLQDGTEQATSVSSNGHQTVSIPISFRRLNSKPAFLRSLEVPDQLSEVGCLLWPLGVPATCVIANVNCGGLYDILGR